MRAFISHVPQETHRLVNALYAALQDFEAISLHTDPDEIHRCDCLLVILSPAVLRDHRVLEEIEYMLAKYVPIVVAMTHTIRLPASLERHDYVDLTHLHFHNEAELMLASESITDELCYYAGYESPAQIEARHASEAAQRRQAEFDTQERQRFSAEYAIMEQITLDLVRRHAQHPPQNDPPPATAEEKKSARPQTSPRFEEDSLFESDAMPRFIIESAPPRELLWFSVGGIVVIFLALIILLLIIVFG